MLTDNERRLFDAMVEDERWLLEGIYESPESIAETKAVIAFRDHLVECESLLRDLAKDIATADPLYVNGFSDRYVDLNRQDLEAWRSRIAALLGGAG